MTSKNNDSSIVVFDDDESRQTKVDLLGDATGHGVKFVSLDGKDVIDEVEKVVTEIQHPCLVLVDHILTKAQEVHKGTSIVPLLRERWPGVPVIAVTADIRACVYELDSEVYDDVVAFEWFGNFVDYAPAVIEGHKALSNQVADVDALFALLAVPDSEKNALQSSLPSALKRSFGDVSFPHRVFRWFRSTFYRKPGFLLDRNWTALAIGVSSEEFATYESGVADAKYDGVLADAKDPRWWKARLYTCLLPESPDRFTISLCEAAKRKLRIPSDHESKCFRCNEKWPEVMGYVDDSATEEKDAKPMHLQCSQTHPYSSPEPFYEERRVMLDDE